MARVDTTKIRILAIERMFQSGKPLNAPQILRRLEMEYDITADRKTIYSDICDLTRFLPIDKLGAGRYTRYQLIDMEASE